MGSGEALPRRRQVVTLLAAGAIRARRPAKPSAVTQPAATSSPRAVATSVRNRPLSRTRSAKKWAPRSWSSSSSRPARDESPFAAAGPFRSPQGDHFAPQNGDGGGAYRGLAPLARIQSEPDIAATDRQTVEQVRGVGGDAGRQDLGLPSGGGDAETGEPVEHGAGAFDALYSVAGQALPIEQETHVGRRADGDDFLAQSFHRVAVDPCQQPAFAPLLAGQVRVEAATHGKAFLFQRRQGLFQVAHGQGQGPARSVARIGPRHSR